MEAQTNIDQREKPRLGLWAPGRVTTRYLARRLEHDSDHNGSDRVSLAIWKGRASLPIIGTVMIWRTAASLKLGHEASITKAIGGKAQENKQGDAATGSTRLA